MIENKIETKEVLVPVKCTCDICKREFDAGDTEGMMEIQEFQFLRFTGGYSSVFGDDTEVEVDICQYCLKEFIGKSFRIIERKKGFYGTKFTIQEMFDTLTSEATQFVAGDAKKIIKESNDLDDLEHALDGIVSNTKLETFRQEEVFYIGRSWSNKSEKSDDLFISSVNDDLETLFRKKFDCNTIDI